MTHINLSIVQHNVLNWKTHRIDLINVYNEINPDVILINSHGNKTNEKIKIFNYVTYQSNRLEERNNGCAIAVRVGIKHRIREHFYSDILSIELDTNLGVIELVTSYVPPRIGYLHYPDFYRLFRQNHPVYYLGDLNVRCRDLGSSSDNIIGKQVKNLISNRIVKHDGPFFPTFITNRSKTTPDIILKNNEAFHNTFAEIGPLTSSDHIPVIYKISTSPIMTEIPPRLNYKKANWERYNNMLLHHPIYPQHDRNSNEIEQLPSEWTNQIVQASLSAIPITNKRIIPHIKPNNRLKNLQAQHTALLQSIQNFGPSYERQETLNLLRNEIKEEYKNLNNDKWNELIANTDTERNNKDFWLSIKRMIGKSTSSEMRYLRGHNNEEVYEDEGKENIFRKNWKKIFQISEEENATFDMDNDRIVRNFIQQNHHKLNPLPLTNYPDLRNETEMITTKEIKNVIKSFKQRAPGEDTLTKYHLERVPPNMIKNLTTIFNASLAIGYYPQQYKNSLMIFIPKVGKSPVDHINYRPISLLNIPGKIFEKIINNRLIQHLEINNLQNPRQHGFRKNRGTNTATAILYETIATAIGNKNKVNLVLRDISKAFDKVWHGGLKFKLIQANLPNYLIRIISNYLDNRTATIKIGQYVGPRFPLLSGVPQGGCLSPTLFALYTADVPPPSGMNEMIIYADDITQIIQKKGSENFLTRETEREISKINQYENKWKIKTNLDKFQIIPILRKGLKKVKVDNKTYEFATTGKALGTVISKKWLHLTCNKQN